MKVGRTKQNLLNLAMWKTYSPIHVTDIYKNDASTDRAEEVERPKLQKCPALGEEAGALVDALSLHAVQ